MKSPRYILPICIFVMLIIANSDFLYAQDKTNTAAPLQQTQTLPQAKNQVYASEENVNARLSSQNEEILEIKNQINNLNNAISSLQNKDSKAEILNALDKHALELTSKSTDRAIQSFDNLINFVACVLATLSAILAVLVPIFYRLIIKNFNSRVSEIDKLYKEKLIDINNAIQQTIESFLNNQINTVQDELRDNLMIAIDDKFDRAKTLAYYENLEKILQENNIENNISSEDIDDKVSKKVPFENA